MSSGTKRKLDEDEQKEAKEKKSKTESEAKQTVKKGKWTDDDFETLRSQTYTLARSMDQANYAILDMLSMENYMTLQELKERMPSWDASLVPKSMKRWICGEFERMYLEASHVFVSKNRLEEFSLLVQHCKGEAVLQPESTALSCKFQKDRAINDQTWTKTLQLARIYDSSGETWNSFFQEQVKDIPCCLQKLKHMMDKAAYSNYGSYESSVMITALCQVTADYQIVAQHLLIQSFVEKNPLLRRTWWNMGVRLFFKKRVIDMSPLFAIKGSEYADFELPV